MAVYNPPVFEAFCPECGQKFEERRIRDLMEAKRTHNESRHLQAPVETDLSRQ